MRNHLLHKRLLLGSSHKQVNSTLDCKKQANLKPVKVSCVVLLHTTDTHSKSASNGRLIPNLGFLTEERFSFKVSNSELNALHMSAKKFLRWFILAAVLFFLLKTLQTHWQEVSQIQVTPAGWAMLAIALGTTLFAHLFAGYVWAWILKGLGQSVTGTWGAKTYLKTNIAKYLPGNIWHFYGRVNAAKKLEIPVRIATLSILLEPLLMAAAACLLASVNGSGLVQIGIAIAILGGIHPHILNPVLNKVGKGKTTEPLKLEHYPIVPLLGELGFLGLRSLGFVITFLAILPLSIQQIPLVVGSFAWAWLLGFVIPGLPGGVGVFEAIAVALLGHQFLPGQVLSVVAVYRLVNTVAEGLGAGLATLDD